MPVGPGKSLRHKATSDADRQVRVQEDLVLIEMVLSGSISQWHTFVDRYSGLIYSVIRRQLFAEDDDEIRTVFADVLAALYKGKLGEFKGRSDLSTWLIVVSRGTALDYLRKRDGRRKLPKPYNDLSPLEQDIFRLHHIEGLGFDVILHTLHVAGKTATAEDVAHAVLKIDSTFDRHYLRRLEYNAKAPALGVASGRLLEYIQHAQITMRRRPSDRPDDVLEQKEIGRRAERVRELLSEFSNEEREVMRLRFEEDWPARRIAETLKFASPRRVYTIIDSISRIIRNKFKNN